MYLLQALAMVEPRLSGVMLGSKCLGAALEYSLLHTRENLVRQEVAKGVMNIAVALRETSQVFLSTWERGWGVCLIVVLISEQFQRTLFRKMKQEKSSKFS